MRNLNLAEKEKNLNWMLDFLQKDLTKLSGVEKARLILELSTLQSDLFPRSDNLPRGFEWVNENVIEVKAIYPGGLQYTQDKLKKFLNAVLKERLTKEGKIKLPDIYRQLVIRDRYEILYSLSKTESAAREDILIDYFARLLEGIPKDAIKECKYCRKLFAHLSNREKIYCSSKCSYKFLSRERRQDLKKHPRKYKAFLKKQRTAMRKIYEERRKAKSSGKVRRREEV